MIYYLLAFISIVLTGSRSGFITTLFFGVLLILKNRNKIRYMIIGIILLSFSWLFIPPDLQGRFESIISPKAAPAAEWAAESAQGRINGLLKGLDLFIENPFWGVGPNNARYFNGPGGVGFQTHNLYGQLLGETGGFGALFFFSFIILSFVKLNEVTKFFQVDNDVRRSIPLGSIDRKSFIKIASAAKYILLLLLFNGNFGHNLFRFNWLFAAFISINFLKIISSYKKNMLCKCAVDFMMPAQRSAK